MKRIKLTPILLIFPISIIAFIVNIRRHWTAFSFYFIIGFILITAVINLFMGSAFSIPCYKLKTIWIIEIVLIILTLILYKGC